MACPVINCGAGRSATTFAPTATWAAARWKISTTVDPGRCGAIRRAGQAGRGRRLHGLQVDGRAGHHADRRLAPVRYAEACVRAMRDAVGDGIDIMVDCHARPSPRMGLMLAKALEPLWAVLVRGALLARKRGRAGRDSTRGEYTDRHGRAVGGAARVSRPGRSAGMQHHSARHHALRRVERGATHCGTGRGLSAGDGAAQPAGASEHGGLAGVRLRDAQLHHLRGGAPGRALAARRRAARDSRSSRRGDSCGPARGRAWVSRSTKPKCASTRSSRRSCCASSTPTAAWGIGKAPVTRSRGGMLTPA